MLPTWSMAAKGGALDTASSQLSLSLSLSHSVAYNILPGKQVTASLLFQEGYHACDILL